MSNGIQGGGDSCNKTHPDEESCPPACFPEAPGYPCLFQALIFLACANPVILIEKSQLKTRVDRQRQRAIPTLQQMGLTALAETDSRQHTSLNVGKRVLDTAKLELKR